MRHLRLRPDHPVHMLAAEHELHGPADHFGGHRRQDLVRPDERLGAEPAPGMWCDDPHLGRRQPEAGRYHGLHSR